jgi:hypothetical protein
MKSVVHLSRIAGTFLFLVLACRVGNAQEDLPASPSLHYEELWWEVDIVLLQDSIATAKQRVDSLRVLQGLPAKYRDTAEQGSDDPGSVSRGLARVVSFVGLLILVIIYPFRSPRAPLYRIIAALGVFFLNFII